MSSSFIDLLARIIGYSFIMGGGAALSAWCFWWVVGKFIKNMGYWPLFAEALTIVGKRRWERKKRKGKDTP